MTLRLTIATLLIGMSVLIGSHLAKATWCQTTCDASHMNCQTACFP